MSTLPMLHLVQSCPLSTVSSPKVDTILSSVHPPSVFFVFYAGATPLGFEMVKKNEDIFLFKKLNSFLGYLDVCDII